jgi:hypothetical protein
MEPESDEPGVGSAPTKAQIDATVSSSREVKAVPESIRTFIELAPLVIASLQRRCHLHQSQSRLSTRE